MINRNSVVENITEMKSSLERLNNRFQLAREKKSGT